MLPPVGDSQGQGQSVRMARPVPLPGLGEKLLGSGERAGQIAGLATCRHQFTETHGHVPMKGQTHAESNSLESDGRLDCKHAVKLPLKRTASIAFMRPHWKDICIG